MLIAVIQHVWPGWPGLAGLRRPAGGDENLRFRRSPRPNLAAKLTCAREARFTLWPCDAKRWDFPCISVLWRCMQDASGSTPHGPLAARTRNFSKSGQCIFRRNSRGLSACEAARSMLSPCSMGHQRRLDRQHQHTVGTCSRNGTSRARGAHAK